jgi:uncharacterized protein YciI
VADYYLVTRVHGPAWDDTRGRREQEGWDEHAAFMDELAGSGFVVLGGPVGEGDGDHVLHVVDASSQEEIHARLADDPWGQDMLRTEKVEPWSVWLRAPALDRFRPVDEWLLAARDRIAAATNENPAGLGLAPDQVDAVLELARVAAHESGERINAPLVCYLAGLAAGRSGTELEVVVDAAAEPPV